MINKFAKISLKKKIFNCFKINKKLYSIYKINYFYTSKIFKILLKNLKNQKYKKLQLINLK